MNSKVDEFTDEDVAYVRSLDLKDGSWKTVDEMPLLKALQKRIQDNKEWLDFAEQNFNEFADDWKYD